MALLAAFSAPLQQCSRSGCNLRNGWICNMYLLLLRQFSHSGPRMGLLRPEYRPIFDFRRWQPDLRKIHSSSHLCRGCTVAWEKEIFVCICICVFVSVFVFILVFVKKNEHWPPYLALVYWWLLYLFAMVSMWLVYWWQRGSLWKNLNKKVKAIFWCQQFSDTYFASIC